MAPVQRAGAIVFACAVLMLAGCATQLPGGVVASETPTPTPTAACPIVEGVELPPDCAPYDPEAAMAQNDRYRERMELDHGAASQNEPAAAAAAEALEAVRASGALSAATVERALADAGLEGLQLRDEPGRVLFGSSGPGGGCVYGEVSEAAVSVKIGGYILDGGCLPAQ